MSNKSFDEKYFDNMLKQALQDIEDEEIKKSEEIYLELKNMPPLKTSLRHKLRMKKLLRTARNNSGRAETKVFHFGRGLVVAIIIISIMSATTMFASADISRFFQWLGFYSEEYIDISISRDYTQRIVEETAAWPHGRVYVPSLVPDGYEITEINTSNFAIIIEYTNGENNYFSFSMRRLGDDNIVSTDNREAVLRKLKVKGFDAVYYETGRTKSLDFNTNEYFFSIVSDVLEERELKKIAENIENLEKLVVK